MTIPQGMTLANIEHGLLHDLLRDEGIRDDVLRAQMKPAVFADETRAGLYAAIVALAQRGELITVENVAHEAHCDRQTVADYWFRPAPGHLTRPPMPPTFAMRCMVDAASARYAQRMIDTLGAACASAETSGDFTVPSRILRELTDYLRRVNTLQAQWESQDEFVARVDRSEHWLVPGVLQRENRMIVVAAEGGGKSYLLRQWAVMLACGAHWMLDHIMPTGRALLVDCENSEAEIARHLVALDPIARTHDENWKNNFALRAVPIGLDFTNHRDVQMVESLIDGFRPDLLVIGPIYRLMGDMHNGWENHARTLQRVLEGWRERYGLAILMEHHAAKGRDESGRRMLDPLGSSAWLRWPEIALALTWNSEERTFGVSSSRVNSRGGQSFAPTLRRGDRTMREWSWIADWTNAGGVRDSLVAINDQARAEARDAGITAT